MAKRRVIIHYHIFKNAGTSVDRMLQESFGEAWASWDTDNRDGKISPSELEAFLLDRPQLAALSSHQIVPPLPSRELDVFPIVFVRHPIDRAYSAYLFEWQKQQGADRPVGSFDDYVREKLSTPRLNAIEDFQVLHLANRGYENRRPSGDLDDEAILGNAKAFLTSLPFFGIVEDYPASPQRMRAAYEAIFPELTFREFHENVLQEASLRLPDKMRGIRESMQPAVFNELVLRNQMDLRLYEFAAAYAAAKSA